METSAYTTYKRILPYFKDMLNKNSEDPSQYWKEEVNGFDYMFEAPPSIINKLRDHCYHITGESPYAYRSHHEYKSGQFKSKLNLLEKLTDKDIFVSEPNILGGFGFDFNQKKVNKDTLKFFECMISMTNSGILDNLINEVPIPTICEIGAGWGGFAHYYLTLSPNSKYIIVDLPETLIFSYIFLSEIFPNKKISLYEYENTSIKDCDILLMPSGSFNNYHENIDLGINICSFQEMTTDQVSGYTKKLSELNCKYLYSLNRDLNKNNKSLDNKVSSLIAEEYKINDNPVLNIPYTNLNANNNSKDGFLFKLKKILKYLLRRNVDSAINYGYKHTIGIKK